MANMQIIPAGKTVAPQFVEMKVPLYSYGCEKKIKKALSHLRGIHSVNVDYTLQKVTIWGICNRDEVVATIRKKRREARLWDSEREEEEEETMHNREIDAKVRVSNGRPPQLSKALLSSFRFRKSWRKLIPAL